MTIGPEVGLGSLRHDTSMSNSRRNGASLEPARIGQPFMRLGQNKAPVALSRVIEPGQSCPPTKQFHASLRATCMIEFGG